MQLTKRLEPSVHCFGGNIVFKQINSEFRIGFRVGWVCFVEVVNTISFDDVVAQKDQESNDQQDSGYQTDDEDDERCTPFIKGNGETLQYRSYHVLVEVPTARLLMPPLPGTTKETVGGTEWKKSRQPRRTYFGFRM